MSNFTAGVIALVLVVSGTFFGFSRWNPFADPYQLTAVFESANNLQPRSQVRVAGVNVGKVKKVETIADSGAARVTMELEDSALPLHEDAELKIRPNLFLEGNFFVDVHPGSPSAPELSSGEVIPSQQTATPVQFGQILAALQSDTRRDLQILLKEYSSALDKGGAEALNRSIEYWEDAYKSGAIAAEATLGQEPTKDIQRMIRGQARTFRALASNEEALKGLVTNFNTTAAAFAREDVALQQTIPALDEVLTVGTPALDSLNGALPSLRAFARDALPGTRSSGPTIDASLPFIRQARLLLTKDELRGLAADLRSAVPDLVRLQQGAVGFFRQTRLLSSCQNRVLLPFATTPIPEPEFANEDSPGDDNHMEPFYKQAPRGLVGLSGESRIHDANTPMFRVQVSGGTETVHFGEVGGEDVFAQAPFPVLGVNPIRPVRRPPFRPDVPCETQEPPDVASRPGVGDTSQTVDSSKVVPTTPKQKRELALIVEHQKLARKGIGSVDPLVHKTAVSRRLEARRNGWTKNSLGLYSERGLDSSGRRAGK